MQIIVMIFVFCGKFFKKQKRKFKKYMDFFFDL